MAVDQQITDPATLAAIQKEAWINARCEEFAANPVNRDRAIATILYDSMMLMQSVGEMMQIVQREGLGGLIKAAMGGLKNGGR